MAYLEEFKGDMSLPGEPKNPKPEGTSTDLNEVFEEAYGGDLHMVKRDLEALTAEAGGGTSDQKTTPELTLLLETFRGNYALDDKEATRYVAEFLEEKLDGLQELDQVA